MVFFFLLFFLHQLHGGITPSKATSHKSKLLASSGSRTIYKPDSFADIQHPRLCARKKQLSKAMRGDMQIHTNAQCTSKQHD